MTNSSVQRESLVRNPSRSEAQQRLCELLELDESAIEKLSSCLEQAGVKTLDDLKLLHENDMPDLPVVLRRKVSVIATALRNGNSLAGIDSFEQLAETNVIRLDVGGKKFTTSRETLCRFPSSFLGAMFSGRHTSLRVVDNEYFIDRNGDLFSYLLDYLRVGTVVRLPSDKDTKEALAVEADFFGLEGVVQAIRLPVIDADRYLGSEVVRIREDEEYYRSILRSNNRATDLPADSREIWRQWSNEGSVTRSTEKGLINLFCNIATPIPFDPVIEVEGPYLMNIYPQKPPNMHCTADSLATFEKSFNQEHANILARLRPVLRSERIVIAGGSVLRALTRAADPAGGKTRTSDPWKSRGDIDLFCYAKSPEEAVEVSRRVFYAISVDMERWVITRTKSVIHMHRWVRDTVEEKVQIILRLYESPAEILYGFDVDCCCCCYNGREVWVAPRWLYAIKHGVNILNPLHAWPNKPSYELRLAKYAQRGFPVVVPGYQETAEDDSSIRRTRLVQLRGLARLKKVSMILDIISIGNPIYNGHLESNEELKREVTMDRDAAQDLITGSAGYDDMGALDIIIPPVYGNGEPVPYMWYDYVGGDPSDFPLMSDCRDEAWDYICDCQDDEFDNIPTLLVDAWDTGTRSRENLNATTMEKHDLDNLYYAEAYGRRTLGASGRGTVG